MRWCNVRRNQAIIGCYGYKGNFQCPQVLHIHGVLTILWLLPSVNTYYE